MTLKVKERPIIFSGPEVRAILDGRKTQMRRVVNPQPKRILGIFSSDDGRVFIQTERLFRNRKAGEMGRIYCPYDSGAHLWVRETFVLERNCGDFVDHEPPFKDGRPVKWDSANGPVDGNAMWLQPHYRATDPTPELVNEDCPFERCADDGCCQHWNPSIHMPRWASRITLEVTGVSVERVQEIKAEYDIKKVYAEGVGWDKKFDIEVFEEFQDLWDTRNAKSGFGWDANPYCWVIEFKRVHQVSERRIP